MHPPGLFQILVIALIVILLFGRGRISRSMGEIGEGVKAFRQRFDDDDATAALPAAEAPLDPQCAADK